MISREFKIGNKQFQLNKLDVFKQFHIVRKVGPILSQMMPLMKDVIKTSKKTESESEKFDQFAELAKPIMEGLSQLTDKDAEFVLYGLLSCVEMKQENFGSWARVSSDSHLNFDNLELPEVLGMAGRAFAYNLSGFFKGLPQ